MRIVMFYHSLVSDWNHGNAHFLRGVATELITRGHEVAIYEPENAWSRSNLIAEHGLEPIHRFHEAYPLISSTFYDPKDLDLDAALAGADLVIVHEWNEHELVQRVGEHRAHHSGYRLLFHDTHHRSVTDRDNMSHYDLSGYDGVLAFGRVIRDLYIEHGWARNAWTWHEGADVRVFRPLKTTPNDGDIVWIGNWGDDERAAEIEEFLVKPVVDLRLKASVYGVRYPEHALRKLKNAGISYRGWLPNFEVPQVFPRFKLTVHIPRKPYVKALPGIPTIRVFEALACGVPMVSALWEDRERLFSPGRDFLTAADCGDMKRQIKRLLEDPALAERVAQDGRETILGRHTCAHRVDELLSIYNDLEGT